MVNLNKVVTSDYVGLSTEEKPANGVENGDTLRCIDTGETFTYYEGKWYEDK